VARPSEQQHPFYKPLWRRVAIVAVIFFWLCFEIVTGSSEIWIVLALGMLAYAVYTFFYTWPKEENGTPKDDGGPSA
jgi:Ca2+/Na+ antiporter